MKKVTWIFVIVLFCFCFSHPVFADESDSPEEQKEVSEKKEGGPWKNFELDLGVALTALNSSVSFGSGSLGVGVTIDVEDALGLDSSTNVFFGRGFYRFGSTRRHRFDFGYSTYRRDSTRVLGENFPDTPIFDLILGGGDTVQTEFNFDIIKAGYTYSLLKDDRMDIGIGGGLFIMPIEFSLSSNNQGARSEEITAPLPVFILRGDFAITSKLFLKAATEVFYLKISNFEGSIVSGNLAIEYNFWKNVGFGLGFNHFRLTVEAEGDDYPNINLLGNIEFEYRGLLLYTKIMF